MAGAREAVSKFEDDSGSRRSMLMVRQFTVAILWWSAEAAGRGGLGVGRKWGRNR